MFNETSEQSLKPWAIYYYSSPGLRYCMARFQSRADGETFLGFVKRKTPIKLYPKLVFDPTNEGQK